MLHQAIALLNTVAVELEKAQSWDLSKKTSTVLDILKVLTCQSCDTVEDEPNEQSKDNEPNNNQVHK